MGQIMQFVNFHGHIGAVLWGVGCQVESTGILKQVKAILEEVSRWHYLGLNSRFVQNILSLKIDFIDKLFNLFRPETEGKQVLRASVPNWFKLGVPEVPVVRS